MANSTIPTTIVQAEAELEAALVRMKANREQLCAVFDALRDGRIAVGAPELKAATKESDDATRLVKRLMKEIKALKPAGTVALRGKARLRGMP